MKRLLLVVVAAPLLGLPADAQIIDYGAAAGAAGLGGGLGAGASKLLTTPIGKAMRATPAQLKQVEVSIAQNLKIAALKKKAGDNAGAAQLYLRAAQDRQRWFNVNDEEAAKSYLDAASSATAAKNFSVAEGACKAALLICNKNNGPGSEKAVPILSALADNLNAQTRYGEAITNYKQALTLQERSGDGNSAECAKMRMALVETCMKAADYATADTMLKQALDGMEAKGQPEKDNKETYVHLLTLQEKELRETCKMADADKVAAKLSILTGVPPAASASIDAGVSAAQPVSGEPPTTIVTPPTK